MHLYPVTESDHVQRFGLKLHLPNTCNSHTYKLGQSIMGQKMCIGIIYINFAARTENFNIFVYFSQKIPEIRYSRNVKNSIGNI